MTRQRVDRRTFVKAMAGSAALASARPATLGGQTSKPRIRFAVIGINHNHINSQVGAVHARRG